MIKRVSHIVLIFLICMSAKSQNILLNNWSIHEHADTNFFLSITAIDQFRHTNIGIGKWVAGSIKNTNKGFLHQISEIENYLDSVIQCLIFKLVFLRLN